MNSIALSRLSDLSGDRLARGALKLDAVVSGANGVAYLAAASLLDGPLGVPASLLRGVGAFFVVFAASVWWVATRRELSRGAVRVVIAANVLWVVDSLLFAAFGWYDPTTGGSVWIVLQALVVAGFAALQAAGLRRVVRM